MTSQQMGEFEVTGVRLDGNIKTDSKQTALLLWSGFHTASLEDPVGRLDE